MPLASDLYPEPARQAMLSNYAFPPVDLPALAVAGDDSVCPVHRIYCVGRNYAAHAAEMGHSEREPPFFFSKPPDAVTQADQVRYPPRTGELHHEVELVVIIGSAGRDIPLDSALDHVYGYAVGVDLTRRDLQVLAKEKSRPWDVAKGFDQSAPISAIQPVSEIGHPTSGRITLSVNGELRQSGDLADMIWSVPEIISELSTYFELMPGDLIFTGTPGGVAAIDPGSVLECFVEGVTSHRFKMTGNKKL